MKLVRIKFRAFKHSFEGGVTLVSVKATKALCGSYLCGLMVHTRERGAVKKSKQFGCTQRSRYIDQFRLCKDHKIVISLQKAAKSLL